MRTGESSIFHVTQQGKVLQVKVLGVWQSERTSRTRDQEGVSSSVQGLRLVTHAREQLHTIHVVRYSGLSANYHWLNTLHLGCAPG